MNDLADAAPIIKRGAKHEIWLSLEGGTFIYIIQLRMRKDEDNDVLLAQ